MAFWSVRPLYRFVEGDRIELHPDWADYIAGNFAIVSGWAERRWIAYLQSRNPLAPAVSEKIAAPVTRAPLTFQTSYWRRAIGAMPDAPRCIYSGVVLDPYSFALDHFLPWTFVCHDALWNLAPVLPAANSAKGNRLPHRGYVHGLVALQHRGLVAASRHLSPDGWESASAAFVRDLHVAPDDLFDPNRLAAAYASTLEPQLAIARTIGFEADWKFDG
jgi:HNH endonuclease